MFRKTFPELIDCVCEKLIDRWSTPRGALELAIGVFAVTAIGAYAVSKLAEDSEEDCKYEMKPF